MAFLFPFFARCARLILSKDRSAISDPEKKPSKINNKISMISKFPSVSEITICLFSVLFLEVHLAKNFQKAYPAHRS